MTKPTPPPSRDQDKFVIRLPEGMRERISEAAAGSGRSMNAEIVQRLEASFGTIEGKMLAHRLDELAALNEATKAAENELAAVTAAGGAPKATLAHFKNRRDQAVTLRDRVQKDVDVLRALIGAHAGVAKRYA